MCGQVTVVFGTVSIGFAIDIIVALRQVVEDTGAADLGNRVGVTGGGAGACPELCVGQAIVDGVRVSPLLPSVLIDQRLNSGHDRG